VKLGIARCGNIVSQGKVTLTVGRTAEIIIALVANLVKKGKSVKCPQVVSHVIIALTLRQAVVSSVIPQIESKITLQQISSHSLKHI
jgi:threonine/homoserine efflux transporter RhtA